MKKQALINYYARLLQKGQVKESEIPPEYKADVQKAYEQLPAAKQDPETLAPTNG